MMSTPTKVPPTGYNPEGDSNEVVVGFLELPSGTFRADPTSTFGPRDADGRMQTIAEPHLTGTVGLTYSRPAQRWLPARRQDVAPDGLHYAYVIGTDRTVIEGGQSYARRQEIHLVDVRTASDKLLFASDVTIHDPFFSIIAYGSDALYVTVQGRGLSPTDQKLWRMDLTSGSDRIALDQRGSWSVIGTKVWGIPSIGDQAGQVISVDLQDQSQQVWLEKDPAVFRVLIGLDAQNRPVVLTVPSTANLPKTYPFEVSRILKPGTQARVGTFTPVKPSYLNLEYFGYLTDSHGGWLGTTSGLYLLSQEKSDKVSDLFIAPFGECY